MNGLLVLFMLIHFDAGFWWWAAACLLSFWKVLSILNRG
jgi:hypothetical protein